MSVKRALLGALAAVAVAVGSTAPAVAGSLTTHTTAGAAQAQPVQVQPSDDLLTPDQRSCIDQLNHSSELVKEGSGPVVINFLGKCFQGNIDVARHWIAQACVTSDFVQEPLRSVLCIAQYPASDPSSSSDKSKCECDKVLDSAGNKVPLHVTPGKQVVLLIHGIGQGPKSWRDTTKKYKDPEGRGTLTERLENDPNLVVGTFDYYDEYNNPNDLVKVALFQWANKDRYAPLLADAIKCLAMKSGMKVSLVGYSRGGRISHEALADPEVADLVAGLVTINTPWLIGGSKASDIPKGVKVMPVASAIKMDGKDANSNGGLQPTSDDGQQQPAPNFDRPSMSDPSAALVPLVRKLRCAATRDRLVVRDIFQTVDGDGCFEHAEQLKAPVTDKTQTVPNEDGLLVRCPPGKLSELSDRCAAYVHENMQYNREIAEPIHKALDGWRDAEETKTGGPIGGCADDPETAPGAGTSGNPGFVCLGGSTCAPGGVPGGGTPGGGTPGGGGTSEHFCDPPQGKPASFHPGDCVYPGQGNSHLVCPQAYHANPENLRECLINDVDQPNQPLQTWTCKPPKDWNTGSPFCVPLQVPPGQKLPQPPPGQYICQGSSHADCWPGENGVLPNPVNPGTGEGQEKAAQEKAAQEKAAQEKAAQEKAAQEKAAQEKA
ncbi:MAG: esterase/lipase family protein, partial [Nocardioidaceae bacterium]